MVISRYLINDLYSNNPEKVNTSLAALNRLYDQIGGGQETIRRLISLFKTKIDKILLASTIRCMGEESEKLLLEELKVTKDKEIKIAILSVFVYRHSVFPNYLEIKLDQSSSSEISKYNSKLPGEFCTYFGKLTSIALDSYEAQSNNKNKEYLEINTKDFLATLQRLIHMKVDHSSPKIINFVQQQANLELLFEAMDKKLINSKFNEFFKISIVDYNNINEYYPGKVY